MTPTAREPDRGVNPSTVAPTESTGGFVASHKEGSASGKVLAEKYAMTKWRFVLTGGPEAGKTTMLNALTARGFLDVPKSVRAIITTRKEAGQSLRPALAQFGVEMLNADIVRYRGHRPIRATVHETARAGVMAMDVLGTQLKTAA